MRKLEQELRDKGNSRSTVKRKLGWLQAVLNYSVEMERIPYSPIAKFKPAKCLKPDLEIWEKSEAVSFLEFAAAKYPAGTDEHWKFLVYLVALNTAMRAGEIWALTPHSLRESFGTIHVTRQFDLTSATFRTLKGKEARNVPLSPTLANEIADWVDFKRIGKDELIFSTGGKPVDHNNFSKRIFKPDLKQWAGRPLKFHGMRHTSATLMLDSGIDIRTVQEILGHKNIDTTMRYVHALGRNVGRAAATFSLQASTQMVTNQTKLVEVAPGASDRKDQLVG